VAVAFFFGHLECAYRVVQSNTFFRVPSLELLVLFFMNSSCVEGCKSFEPNGLFLPFRWHILAGFSSACLVVICNSHYVGLICGVHNWLEIFLLHLKFIDVVHDSSIFVREVSH